MSVIDSFNLQVMKTMFELVTQMWKVSYVPPKAI